MVDKHQVIFLNGPRHSGKDTAGIAIYEQYISCDGTQIRLMKLAFPLKQAAMGLFGITAPEIREWEKPGSTAKLEKQDKLMGMSWVESLIWLSEECVKPKLGRRFFGEYLTRLLKARTMCKLTVITDSGFLEEADPIIDQIGPENCHLFQLHRPGCSFDGDSRNYWTSPRLPINNIHFIKNVHELSMFKEQLFIRVDKILGINK